MHHDRDLDHGIDWPDHLVRTSAADRERTSKFSVPLGQTLDELEAALERIGATEYRLSTAAPQRQSDRRPHADARPDDPGIAVRWRMDGQQYAVACDRWSRLRDNAREVTLYLEEKRKMEGRPVATGQSEFASAALPSPDRDDVVVAGAGSAPDREPHEVLGVAPDADDAVVRGAFRELAKRDHGDHGGSGDIARLKQARDALLDP
jgi:hypothetical protein